MKKIFLLLTLSFNAYAEVDYSYCNKHLAYRPQFNFSFGSKGEIVPNKELHNVDARNPKKVILKKTTITDTDGKPTIVFSNNMTITTNDDGTIDVFSAMGRINAGLKPADRLNLKRTKDDLKMMLNRKRIDLESQDLRLPEGVKRDMNLERVDNSEIRFRIKNNKCYPETVNIKSKDRYGITNVNASAPRCREITSILKNHFNGPYTSSEVEQLRQILNLPPEVSSDSKKMVATAQVFLNLR